MGEAVWKSDECKRMRRETIKLSLLKNGTTCLLLSIVAILISIIAKCFNDVLIVSVLITSFVCTYYSCRIDYVARKNHFCGYIDSKFDEGDDFFEE